MGFVHHREAVMELPIAVAAIIDRVPETLPTRIGLRCVKRVLECERTSRPTAPGLH